MTAHNDQPRAHPSTRPDSPTPTHHQQHDHAIPDADGSAASAQQFPLGRPADTVATLKTDGRPERRNSGTETMSSHRLQRDAIREFVARTRADQGLPPTIEDPIVLNQIAAVFKLVEESKANAG